jgi:energy-coupling factor transporter ATP-binding protein EcfA2
MPTVLEDVMFGPKNFGYLNEEAEAKCNEKLFKK